MRCNLIKIEEIKARQHMQHETNYHNVNLEQAPAMVDDDPQVYGINRSPFDK